jgi:non-specific serine/threonine protein kinase/serine/threonine-protein kinase
MADNELRGPFEGSEGSTAELSSKEDLEQPVPGFRLLQKIGEGGMGEVYEAEQLEPVRRRVAIKLIKWGMDTREVIARFESERQALALMDHPGIATVLDGGATESGRPYFVMEYVKGVPINDYCDTHRLSTHSRLELFIGVCEAVQHAHQKGIIHRDLKPSNVLVTVQDDRPVAKVIDFGVAKATAQRLTEQTVFTEFGQLIGTPEYMSPEQAEMSSLDIDTRSDVYSLGVMLYELLTGALPFDPRELRRSGLDEIRRKIREEDPSRPSTRVSTLGDRFTDTAAKRRTDTRSLVRQLRGDLDWITMKALDKDRTRRYATALGLAADIGRFLRHQPVVAGPPSVGYRARKFVRRHRVGVAVAALSIVLLGVFAVRERIHARQVAVERDTAQQVSDFLIELFAYSDPERAKGEEIPVRELLDRGAERIDTELAGQPVVQARMMNTLGRVYLGLGHYEEAERLLESTVDIRRAELGDLHVDTLSSLDSLAGVFLSAGDLDRAETLIREALEGYRLVLGDDDPSTLFSAGNLGTLLLYRGDLEQAERYCWEAVVGLQKVLEADDPDLIVPMANLAYVYHQQGRYDEAETHYREALAVARRVLGNDHPDTLNMISGMSYLLKEQDRLDEAEPYYREALEGRRRVLGDDHPSTLTSLANLGLMLKLQAKFDEAERCYLEALEARRRILGDDHPETLITIANLGSLQRAQGRFEEAERSLRQALEGYRRTLGDDHPETINVLNNLGVLLRDTDRLDEAEAVLLEAVENSRRVQGDDHPRTLRAVANLGSVRRDQGRLDEADSLYREALEGQRRVLGDLHKATRSTLENLVELSEERDLEDEVREWTRLLHEIETTSAD